MAEFTKIIPISCLQGSGLVLPADFREEVVKTTGSFTLQNGAGKQWPCTITRKQQGTHERADITGGWRPFAKANGFKAGDEINVVHVGGGVLKITKTGRTGDLSARTPTVASKALGKTPARKSASKTPGTARGVSKRRGSSSAARKWHPAAAAAVAAAVLEPVPVALEEVEEGALPEYVPPAPEAGYMQPIWPTWCAIM